MLEPGEEIFSDINCVVESWPFVGVERRVVPRPKARGNGQATGNGQRGEYKNCNYLAEATGAVAAAATSQYKGEVDGIEIDGMQEDSCVSFWNNGLVEHYPRRYVKRPLGMVLPRPRPPLYEVAEEGRSGGEYGLVTGQLELGSKSVLGTAAVRSLVVAVRGEDECGVRVVPGVQ